MQGGSVLLRAERGTSRTLHTSIHFSWPLSTGLWGGICRSGLEGDIGGGRSTCFCHTVEFILATQSGSTTAVHLLDVLAAGPGTKH